MHTTGLQEYERTYLKMKRGITIVVGVARKQGTALQYQKPCGVHARTYLIKEGRGTGKRINPAWILHHEGGIFNM